MSQTEVKGALHADTDSSNADADVLRRPWRKPQMWLLDYAETENTAIGVAESESTSYGPAS